LLNISKFFFPKIIKEVKKQAAECGLPLRIMFQDEARFGRITDPRRCWAPKGVRPIISSQLVREYTYHYGAVSPQDGKSDFLILPSMNLANMEIFLQELRWRYPNEYICIFFDGAPGHSLEGLKVPENMAIEKLPAYSPETNPTENIWDDMREKFFRNLLFHSMEAVVERLCEVARAYEADHRTVS
jgi:transposase